MGESKLSRRSPSSINQLTPVTRNGTAFRPLGRSPPNLQAGVILATDGQSSSVGGRSRESYAGCRRTTGQLAWTQPPSLGASPRETVESDRNGVTAESSSGGPRDMRTTDLEGSVALVTGGSLGIGRATCMALARAGARVAVNYRAHADEAEQVVQAIRDIGSHAWSIQADVADGRAVERMVQEVVGHFGKLDIAVANAAYSDREAFVEADMEGFRRTVDVTMWGAFFLCRYAAQAMIAQGTPGTLVLVSSPHAEIAVPASMAYNMSKAAVEQMARTAAVELAPHAIRVNVIQPGWIDTPGERKYASEEALRLAGRRIPLGRLGTADEIADAIVVLTDPRHQYMTGATLRVDGGISLPWWAADSESPKLD